MTGLYGKVEVVYYQLTPMGVQRAQNPSQTKGLDSATRKLLQEILNKGGTAEWDELKFMSGYDSPTVLSTALRRLTDLGYVTSITPATSEGM